MAKCTCHNYESSIATHYTSLTVNFFSLASSNSKQQRGNALKVNSHLKPCLKGFYFLVTNQQMENEKRYFRGQSGVVTGSGRGKEGERRGR